MKKNCKGKNNGFWGKHHTVEVRRKISEALKGKKPWNTGKKLSEEHKKKLKKISIKNKNKPPVYNGENHPRWVGDKITYSSLHQWLVANFGKACRCENPKCEKRSNFFEWAKIKGKPYKRERKYFWQLCCVCHHKYDDKVKKMLKTKLCRTSN